MYHPHPLKLSPEQLERFRHLATCVDISPGPGGSRMSDHAETERVFGPDLQPVLAGPYQHVTVVALYPGAQIHAHTDVFRGIRHHIPLVLNDGCWVFSAGDWQQLEAGQVYSMNPNLLHGAVNWGATRRLHLIVDRA
jgi:quercetin dioxygenase-like cupin family protein